MANPQIIAAGATGTKTGFAASGFPLPKKVRTVRVRPDLTVVGSGAAPNDDGGKLSAEERPDVQLFVTPSAAIEVRTESVTSRIGLCRTLTLPDSPCFGMDEIGNGLPVR
jgi:hypothetical protein